MTLDDPSLIDIDPAAPPEWDPFNEATTALVDVWKENFNYRPVSSREVLYRAIEEDRHILYALEGIQKYFHMDPTPRLLDRLLRKHENHLFYTSTKEPVRLVQLADKRWCLRDSENLQRVAGIAC